MNNQGNPRELANAVGIGVFSCLLLTGASWQSGLLATAILTGLSLLMKPGAKPAFLRLIPALFGLIAGGFVLREALQVLDALVLPLTPQPVLAIALPLLVALGALGGRAAVGRASKLTLPFLIAILVLVILMQQRHARPGRLLPLIEIDALTDLRYGACALPFLAYPLFEKQGGTQKLLWLRVLLSGLTATAVLVLATALGMSAPAAWSTLQARDTLPMLVWLPVGFLLAAYAMAWCADAYSQVCGGKDARWFLIPGLAVLLALCIPKSASVWVATLRSYLWIGGLISALCAFGRLLPQKSKKKAAP